MLTNYIVGPVAILYIYIYIYIYIERERERERGEEKRPAFFFRFAWLANRHCPVGWIT